MRILAGVIGIAAVCGIGCGDRTAREPPPGRPTLLVAVNPETASSAIFAVLDRIELAIRKATPAVLEPVLDATYVEVACGDVHRHADRAAAATSRIGHGVGSGWEVTFANDGAMAWAISTGSARVHVEVLESRASGWVLVAGAVSTFDASECKPSTDAPSPPREPTAPDAPILAAVRAPALAGLAKEASLVSCGRWRGMDLPEKVEWKDSDDLEQVLRFDDNSDKTPDFTRSIEHGQLSTGAQMAWMVARPSESQGVLAIAAQDVSGWAITAGVWAPDADASAMFCDREPRRGRVYVTDRNIEIIDHVYFRKNQSDLEATSRGVLDSIASSLKSNPEITRLAVEGLAESDEVDPMGLSERRAMVARQYLRDRGISIDRLDAWFSGDDAESVDDQDDDEPDDDVVRIESDPTTGSNRRVRFRILSRRPIK